MHQTDNDLRFGYVHRLHPDAPVEYCRAIVRDKLSRFLVEKMQPGTAYSFRFEESVEPVPFDIRGPLSSFPGERRLTIRGELVEVKTIVREVQAFRPQTFELVPLPDLIPTAAGELWRRAKRAAAFWRKR